MLDKEKQKDRMAGSAGEAEVEAHRRCLLCEGVIEMIDHDVYFTTGYCRYCHAALEEDA